MARFFISYSHSDKEFADRTAAILESNGLPCFLDRKDIGYGDAIADEVRDGLNRSAFLIVIVSPGSLKSRWVPYEIGYAHAKGARVLPLLTHPEIDVDDFIRDLKAFRTLDEFTAFCGQFGKKELFVEALVEPCHCIDLSKLDSRWTNRVAFNKYPLNRQAAEMEMPALRVEVTNRGAVPVRLSRPQLIFKAPFEVTTEGKEVRGIQMLRDHDWPESYALHTNESRSYTLWGNEGIIAARAFCQHRVFGLQIRDEADEFQPYLADGNLMPDCVRYFQHFFPALITCGLQPIVLEGTLT